MFAQDIGASKQLIGVSCPTSSAAVTMLPLQGQKSTKARVSNVVSTAENVTFSRAPLVEGHGVFGNLQTIS